MRRFVNCPLHLLVDSKVNSRKYYSFRSIDEAMPEFTHFDEDGATRMVDVGSKEATQRVATATATVRMQPETLGKITSESFAKGDVLEVARLAGIMATKQTGQLIPLCHPIGIDRVNVDFEILVPDRIVVRATVGVFAKTGVEMEAMTAVSVAALTIYDMCKSVDRGMEVQDVMLLEKSGGKSGHYKRSEQSESTSASQD